VENIADRRNVPRPAGTHHASTDVPDVLWQGWE